MMKSRYLIRLLDDDEEFLDAMSFLLETEGWRTAAYSDAEAFMRDVSDEPGVIVLDVRMPNLSGPEVQRILTERRVRIPVIFLTGHGDINVAVHVFREGACDFLQKPVSHEDLVRAVERAARIDDKRREEEDSPFKRWEMLTEREKTIVADVAQGLSNKAIAEHFGISERTVEAHRSSAQRKLGIRRPKEAAELIERLKAAGMIV